MNIEKETPGSSEFKVIVIFSIGDYTEVFDSLSNTCIR